MKKRLDWLDVGKGLGMLLVMMGHADIPAPLKTYIYTFHMPLFFFLSGYLFKLKKFLHLKDFLAKRTRSLIFPYLCFSFVAYTWFLIIIYLGMKDYHKNLLIPLIGSFIAIRKSIWTVHSGALWFVACLFCTEFLFYLVTKLGRTNKRITLLLILLSIFGCIYNKVDGKPLPWSADIAMISVGFYRAGFLFKEYHENIERFLNLKTFVFLIEVNAVTGYLNFVHAGERVDFYNSNLGNIFLFYLSAFSGIGAFIILIKNMNSNKSLQYIGKNSFIYLALHQKVVFFLFNHSMLNSEHNLLIKGLMYTLLAAVIMVPAVYSVNHFFPFMLGKIQYRNKFRGHIKASQI